ncbi:glycosyltransferase [uncultured Draconibacterium sp.]|uniref:glycosyltransferase n=1 Tax=uncultured Draconibacterium sp. TaxID=1573823 RepID=UPI0032176E2D
MKLYIGYIITPNTFVSGLSNGVRSQALQYKKALEKLGHKVELINSWDIYDLNSFDIVHIFGSGSFLSQLIPDLFRKKIKIVLSPILDTNESSILIRLKSYLGIKKINLHNNFSSLRSLDSLITGYMCRSEYEFNIVKKGFAVKKNKIGIVPVGHEKTTSEIDLSQKEPFCLHVSSLYQERKNVIRLIRAASTSKIKLKLVGSTGNKAQQAKLKQVVEQNPNVELIGFVSEEELISLYKRAKCFALPSLMEGVGIVALDAASYGCEVVLTKRGGPKEYFRDLAHFVDPLSIKSIKKGLEAGMKSNFQPGLKDYIYTQYSETMVVEKLLSYYFEIINR